MALSKPTNTVDFTAATNTDAAGGTDPGASFRHEGFYVGNKVPARWLNWLFVQISLWFAWLNQYFFSSGNDLTISALPTSPSGTNVTGGTLVLESGSTTGNEGSILELKAAVAGGFGTTVHSPSSFLTLDGTSGTPSLFTTVQFSSNSGIVIQGPLAVNDTIQAFDDILADSEVKAFPYSSPGGSNTDCNDLVLSSGFSTASASTSTVLKASTTVGSGPGVNTPETYLTCDGSNGTVHVSKALTVDGASTFQAVTAQGLTVQDTSTASGTDVDGADILLSAGDTTGSGGTKVILSAAVAGISGTTHHAPADFLTCDGDANVVLANKPFRLNSVSAHVTIPGLMAFTDAGTFSGIGGVGAALLADPSAVMYNVILPAGCTIDTIAPWVAASSGSTSATTTLYRKLKSGDIGTTPTGGDVKTFNNPTVSSTASAQITLSSIAWSYDNSYYYWILLSNLGGDSLKVGHIEIAYTVTDNTSFTLG